MTGFYRFMVHNFPAATYLPGAPRPGIFSTEKLNFRVRDGNGWVLLVIATENLYSLRALFIAPSKLHNTSFFFSDDLGQALGLLVPVRSTHCCAYTPGLSTMLSSWGLTSFTEWDVSSRGGLHA